MLKKTWKPFLLLSFTTVLAGCASIINGQDQTLGVNTANESGAKCTLTNERGEWTLNSTPGRITVQRSTSPLRIVCTKGCKTGTVTVESSTKGMAIAGGLIGAAVDCSTGAAYDYPDEVTVPLN